MPLKEKEMSYEFIKYEVSDNGVANVLLNRPEKLNALSLHYRRNYMTVFRRPTTI